LYVHEFGFWMLGTHEDKTVTDSQHILEIMLYP